ncbi:alpha-amylase [Algoriella xinjiangensis]|uniref:Alpha-amylase n=1 Tax=Algoriella xinjiangensis TaxID=684065 RepID=A0A1I4VB54_9FLAO|nr:alpha-amylase family glycosyl hydrolase [Algoriella xinjiangensis]SFM98415.1 alpha-amylase [Algoriella xinjiangensis]VDH17078.1 Alpha-amylase precursor [Algoriella xinjiangensis]
MKKIFLTIGLASLFLSSCAKTTVQGNQENKSTQKQPFVWNGANVYFLLTDRFNNGDKTNDINYGRTAETAKLRGFEGGDIRGVIQKIDQGYFTDLGINAIWMTPIVEQIHGYVDEGQGKTYGFHGYWTKDWTTLDKNFGTEKDLKELVDKAHAKGIRIMLDAVINHTGPVTNVDGVFPADWVRVSPQCTYESYKTTIECTLVANLPDILTESENDVMLPPQLLAKWSKEGRLEKEVAELNAFFAKYNLPKAPKYYIMKWLSDYVRKYGIDAYRVDTVKHTEEDVWKKFEQICNDALAEYKTNNPTKAIDNTDFFLLGEVYNYTINDGQIFPFPDKKVNYFENGFDALINFDLRSSQKESYQQLFDRYDKILHNDMNGKTVMSYITSHDDGSPFDKNRENPWDAGTRLLLAPGISQVYYGDETARPLEVQGVDGDANLRSFMNWDDIKPNSETESLLIHFQKLGQFRRNHPAVGAGKQTDLQNSPYIFIRKYKDDEVIIGLDLSVNRKEIDVKSVWADGTKVRDAYSNQQFVVKDGKISIDAPTTIVLVEKVN